jgi:SAM-dependent methyltransferase
MANDLSAEAVTWGYRLFLDREPESGAAVERALSYGSVVTFRKALLASDEFNHRNPRSPPTLPLDVPPIDVEWETDSVSADVLLSYVRETWTRLGTERPHWSVLSADRFMPEHIAQSEAEFFASGNEDLADLTAILLRSGIRPDRLRHAFEFGCGVARVTPYLARTFASVTACDVSSAHLQMAREVIARTGATNTELILAEADKFGMAAPFDLWFSRIVLQHNPPPVMALILRRALSLLAPGGVAVFQVPTYCRGYHFDTSEYLAALNGGGRIEMHVLPQAAVFHIAFETGCRPLEVREDSATGLGSAWLSNTFVLTKPGTFGKTAF